MLRRVAVVRIDVSKKLSASIITVTRIGELGTLTVTSNRSTLRRTTNIIQYDTIHILCISSQRASVASYA
jgi:hypothetical protein